MYFFGETSSHLNLMEKRKIIFSLIVNLRRSYNNMWIRRSRESFSILSGALINFCYSCQFDRC